MRKEINKMNPEPLIIWILLFFLSACMLEGIKKMIGVK